VRERVNEHVKVGRARYEAGDFRGALAETRQALKLDPSAEEAAELLWRSQQKLRQEAQDGPNLKERVAALLARAGVTPPGEDAQQALTELALIAPDHPRVVELLKQRNRGSA
jgi:hypothetical protein